MATGVSTRQQILFHHPTYHIYHIYYEDCSRGVAFWIIGFFLPAKGSGLHNKILTKLVKS